MTEWQSSKCLGNMMNETDISLVCCGHVHHIIFDQDVELMYVTSFALMD